MPGGDRSGPLGYGPRTGRGMGYCGGYETPGYMNPTPAGFGFRRGWGRWHAMGRGRGLGFRWRRLGLYWPTAVPVRPVTGQPNTTLSKEEEKALIETELKSLDIYLKEIEEEKKNLEKRLKELEK